MPAVSTIIGGALGVASISEGRKARKQQQRASEIQQKSQRLQTARQAVDQIRQAQIARAQVIASGEAAGVGDSSAVLGGAGSIQSQAGGNIAFLQQLSTLQAQANARLQSAQRASFRAGALGQFAGTIANTSFDNIFGNPQSSVGQNATASMSAGGTQYYG